MVDLRSNRPEKKYNIGLRQVVAQLLLEQQQLQQIHDANTDHNIDL
jgi:hypothetical protein